MAFLLRWSQPSHGRKSEPGRAADISFNAIGEDQNDLGIPLVDAANVATFFASDNASAMTATVTNISCGQVTDKKGSRK